MASTRIGNFWRTIARIGLVWLSGLIGPICLWTGCFGAGVAWTADVSVELAVDRAAVGVGEEIQLQAIVKGTQSAENPDIEGLGSFEVTSSGSSSQFQMVNGTTTIQKVFQYQLTPKKEGTFKIGPATVSVSGKKYTSNSISIQVAKGSSPDTNNDAGSGSLYQVHVRVSDKSPYVNGQLLYTFEFISRAPIQNAQLNLPEFKGFWKEQLGKETETEKVIDGVVWHVNELRFALFPLSEGTLSIDPATLNGEVFSDSGNRRRARSPFDGFFNDSFPGFGAELKRMRLRTETLTLNVRPLPSAGKPAGFTGLVGQFALDGALSKNAVTVGDSTMLTLKLRGQGNLRDAHLPELSWPEFKVYDDNPVLETESKNGRIGGSKTFKRALVPLKGGTLTIPAVKIAYFDPAAGTYQFAESRPMSLTVTGNGAPESLDHVGGVTSAQKGIQVRGEDLMPIRRTLADSPKPFGGVDLRNVLIVIFAGPLFYLLAFGYRKRRDRLRADAGYVRRGKAYRVFREGLSRIDPDKAFYENASQILRIYLGDRLGLDGKALTPADAQRRLKPLGLSEETVREVGAFLLHCDHGRFGAEVPSSERATELTQKLADLGKRLEKETVR